MKLTLKQTNAWYSTAIFVKSYRNDLHSFNIVQGGKLEPETLEWQETELAFKSFLASTIIKNFTHKDPERFFEYLRLKYGKFK